MRNVSLQQSIQTLIKGWEITVRNEELIGCIMSEKPYVRVEMRTPFSFEGLKENNWLINSERKLSQNLFTPMKVS